MPRLNLRHNLPLFIALVVVTAAVPLTVFVAITQKTSLNSKAQFAQQGVSLTEFGTVISLPSGPGVGKLNSNQLAQNNAKYQVLGTRTNKLARACIYSQDGQPACPLYNEPLCPNGVIISGPLDECGCLGAPICQINIVTPTSTPRPTPPPYVSPTPTLTPGQQYGLQTSDGRIYPLLSRLIPLPCPTSPPGISCIQVMTPEINFSPYLGKTVLVEGQIQGDAVTNLLSLWPLPGGLNFFVRNIQMANKMDSFAIQQRGILLNTFDKYQNENVFLVTPPTYTCEVNKCPRMPVWPPYYLRSSKTDLSKHLGSIITPTGDTYAVGQNQDLFVDMTSMTTEATATPTINSCAKSGEICYGIAGTPCCGDLYCRMESPQTPDRGGRCETRNITPIPTTQPTPATEAKTDLYFRSNELQVNQNTEFTTEVLMSTYGNEITAAAIYLQYDKEALIITSIVSDTTTFGQTLQPPTIDNTDGKASIILGIFPGTPNINRQGIPVFTLKGKTTNKVGQTKIIFSADTAISGVGFENNKGALRATYPLTLIVANTHPGDLNDDGVVDIFDYNILVSNFGQQGHSAPGVGRFSPADIDENGVVNIFDYNIVVSTYGAGKKVTPSSSSTVSPF